ncbi:MAG: hypothetical protein DME60_13950 [Verrucomicrobia bacterium]|nr:MAG: hypothetical protein DME60_13950 [Verrucomicrobiota bacterium]
MVRNFGDVKTVLSPYSFIAVLCFLTVAPVNARAQQWAANLPKKSPQELTFKDFQKAFQEYSQQHPVGIEQENVAPKQRFEKAEAIQAKIAIEEQKLFKRWEWLMEPRTYPSGRLNQAAITEIRERISEEDKQLLKNAGPAAGPMMPAGPPVVWKFLGPSDAIGGTNMGRVNSINFDPKNSKIIYIGTPDGGVWRSATGGTAWSPLFDSQPTLSVGDVAVDPNDSKTLYVATSDPYGYGTPFWGGTYSVGVRKSTNGGTTWSDTGLPWRIDQNRTIRRLVIHPTDSKILLAATSDGVYRTDNAGLTWNQVVTASAYDAEFQHNDGKIAYVTTSHVMKSTNAGETFDATTATCCFGSRYSIEIAHSNPKTLYTLCTDGAVQKSTDAGASWANTRAPGVSLYGYYDNVLAVSPVSDKVVWVAGFNIMKTTDGGATWASVPTAGHTDNHVLRFLPSSGSTILAGNDGGLFKSTNSGSTWTSLNKGLAITQFYGVGSSKTTKIMELGAQDNGHVKYDTGTWTSMSIQYGELYRSTNGGTTFGCIDTPCNGNWVTPLQQDPTKATTIYAATCKVYKSTDQGIDWTDISGTLAGITTFVSLKVAPSDPNYIYAGSGNKLYRTITGGMPWHDITAGLPVVSNYLTDVTVSDTDPKLVWVTFSGYNATDKVYKSQNGGETWENISGTLPNMPVNAIVYEKKADNPVYIGTDAGVYYRNDGLADWVPYKSGLPNVIVDRLEILYGTKVIRAATYGRGCWEAPLR